MATMTAPAPIESEAWMGLEGTAYAEAPDVVARRLGVEPAVGLSSDEAVRRSGLVGSNELAPVEHESVLSMLIEAVTEPFIIVLLVSGIGAILLGEVRDGLLVLFGLLPIVIADVVTGYRGDRALEALREASAPVARIRRDGAVGEVPAAVIVPGDVVLLRGGDIVPADVRLLRADRLLVDRSVLTGESVPEPAAVDPDAATAPLAERRAMAYAGTSVVGGRGEGLVIATGQATEVGRIAGGLAPRGHRRSPLQAELDRLIRILLFVAIGLIVTVTGLGFLRGQTLGENLLAGISAAIAAIPEEPPVLLAVVLGLGAYRLLRRGVLVRRLNAEETLGAVDLIITDKTGTLTHNRLEVASLRTPAGSIDDLEGRQRMLLDAIRAEDDAWATSDGMPPGSFTQALTRALADGGGEIRLDPADLVEAEPVADGRPFSRTRVREHRAGELDGRIATLAIGAPETILGLAATDAAEHDTWEALLLAGAASGERLVGLASGDDGGPIAMRGLIGFADPLRDGIREALRTATDAGIQTIVVTGDHPLTAAAIAREAGLEAGHIVVGDVIAAEDDEALARELSRMRVVARSTPDQKERLVRIAREHGRTVAVTGDGVNDAPALNRADVAVAMGSGTAVAKEAADLVLGDDSFATLLYGLAEGRRIVDNVQKGLVFLISTHVALLGFIFIATLVGFGQPLLPIQILWLELFIDLSTSVAFERERPEPDLMHRPPRIRGVPLLTDGILTRIAIAGGFSAVCALLIMLFHDGTPEHARWLAYTTLVCAQAVRAYANRSLRIPIHRLAPNGFLLLAAIATIVIQVAIPLVPPLAEAFRATPLDASDWLIVALVALTPALVAESVRTATGRLWIA